MNSWLLNQLNTSKAFQRISNNKNNNSNNNYFECPLEKQELYVFRRLLNRLLNFVFLLHLLKFIITTLLLLKEK